MVLQESQRFGSWDMAEDAKMEDAKYLPGMQNIQPYLAVKNTFIAVSTPEDSDDEAGRSGSNSSPRRRNLSAPPSPNRSHHVCEDVADDVTSSVSTDCGWGLTDTPADVLTDPKTAEGEQSEEIREAFDLSSWFTEVVPSLNPNAPSFEPASMTAMPHYGVQHTPYTNIDWSYNNQYDEANCQGLKTEYSYDTNHDFVPTKKPTPVSTDYSRDKTTDGVRGTKPANSATFGARLDGRNLEQNWRDEGSWTTGYRKSGGSAHRRPAYNDRAASIIQLEEPPTKLQAHGTTTTMMLKNIPCRKTQESIMQQVDDEGFHDQYDFFYVPQDVKCQANLGYAFINFPNPEHAARFQRIMHGYKFPDSLSRKVCIVVPAHVQGMKNNLAAFRRTEVMRSSRKPFFRTSMASALQQ